VVPFVAVVSLKRGNSASWTFDPATGAGLMSRRGVPLGRQRPVSACRPGAAGEPYLERNGNPETPGRRELHYTFKNGIGLVFGANWFSQCGPDRGKTPAFPRPRCSTSHDVDMKAGLRFERLQRRGQEYFRAAGQRRHHVVDAGRPLGSHREERVRRKENRDRLLFPTEKAAMSLSFHGDGLALAAVVAAALFAQPPLARVYQEPKVWRLASDGSASSRSRFRVTRIDDAITPPRPSGARRRHGSSDKQWRFERDPTLGTVGTPSGARCCAARCRVVFRRDGGDFE